jgi:hypothetical protein
MVEARVARFFLVQQTKTGKNVPNDQKIHQIAIRFTKMAAKFSKWLLTVPTFSIPRLSKV